MVTDSGSCSNPECGCHERVFSTAESCPECGERLRLSGNLQKAIFHLACPKCGYRSRVLSQEELQVLL